MRLRRRAALAAARPWAEALGLITQFRRRRAHPIPTVVVERRVVSPTGQKRVRGYTTPGNCFPNLRGPFAA
jgi:hypothetical protein